MNRLIKVPFRRWAVKTFQQLLTSKLFRFCFWTVVWIVTTTFKNSGKIKSSDLFDLVLKVAEDTIPGLLK